MAHIDAGKTTTTERILYYTGRSAIRSARSMTAPPPWTGWSRSRSAASPSRRPRPPASGAIIASTSSTRRATSTSPSRSSGRCACLTARSPCSTRSPASSRSRRRCGARRTSTACRACASSTRWTAPARTSSRCVEMIKDRLGAVPLVLQLPIGAEADFVGLVDLVENRAVIWKDESLGAEFEYRDIPDDLKDAGRGISHRDDRNRRGGGRRRDGGLSGRRGAGSADTLRACIRKGTIDLQVRAGAAGQRVQEQGRAADA